MNNSHNRALILLLLLLFSVGLFENTFAQSDDLVLEWEQHWETFGKGGSCNYGTSNFYVGDIDNDEIVELVTGGFQYYLAENGTRISSEAPLRIWNWDGEKFTCEKSHNWIGSIQSIYAYDFDSDGFKEIITGGRVLIDANTSNSIKIWSYDGENINQKGEYNGIQARSIYVVDLDSDKIPEVITEGRVSDQNRTLAQLSIFQWENNNLYLRKSVEWCASNEAYAYSVYAQDLDNDGKIEIITGGYDNDLINSSGQLRVWRWNGEELTLEANNEWRLVEGVYGKTVSGLPMGNTMINNVKVDDVDSDGILEIITGGWSYDGERINAQLKIWNWNGQELILEKSFEWITNDINEIKAISLSDVDKDGEIEIVTSGITAVYGSFNNPQSTPDHAQLRIFSWNDNTLKLEQSKDWTIGEGVVVWNLATDDIDKDGTVEIITIGCMGETGLCDPDLRIWSLNIQNDFNFIIFAVAFLGIAILLIVIYLIRKNRIPKKEK